MIIDPSGRIRLVLAVTVIPLGTIGSEFMPPLEEGTLFYMPTTMPGISITEATIERLLQPGVEEEQFRAEFASLTLGSGAAAILVPGFARKFCTITSCR